MEKPAPDEQPWQWIMSVTQLLISPSQRQDSYNLDLPVSNTDVPIPPGNDL